GPRHALFGVGQHHGHTVVAGLMKTGAGALHDLLVDVHRDDVSALADELSHQSGVVATGADLQHAHPRFDLGLFQHDGLDVGGGEGTQGHAVAVALDHDRVVRRIGRLQRLVRYEQVPGHGGHGCRHRLGPNGFHVAQLVDHAFPQLGGPSIVGGHVGHSDPFSVLGWSMLPVRPRCRRTAAPLVL